MYEHLKMEKPCVIVIERNTREHLKQVARKNQRYTDILEELIALKESTNKNGNQ
jgi:hypothetical protein